MDYEAFDDPRGKRPDDDDHQSGPDEPEREPESDEDRFRLLDEAGERLREMGLLDDDYRPVPEEGGGSAEGPSDETDDLVGEPDEPDLVTASVALDDVAPGGPEAAEDDGVFQPRCNVCKLPDDVRQLAHALYFDQGLSTAAAASQVNAELDRRGLPTRILARSLRTHLAAHGPRADRVAYATKAPPRGGRDAKIPGPPSEALAILREEKFRGRRDDVAFVRSSLLEAFEEWQAHMQDGGAASTDQERIRAYANLAKLGRSFLSAAETSRRMANPKRVGMVLSEVLVDSFIKDATSALRDAAERLETDLLWHVPEQKRDHIDYQVGLVANDLSRKLRDLKELYRKGIEEALDDPDDDLT
ncbi:MAG: hypothetical protein KDC38_20760 [Planctomycetes bacterium]|nr:hypothetical protein [Planctomycetota bacterium]